MVIQNIFEKEKSIEMIDNEIPEVDVDRLMGQIESLQPDSGVTEVQVDLKHRRCLIVGNKRKVRKPSWNGSLGVEISICCLKNT